MNKEVKIMTDENLRENIKKYRKVFGTSLCWMAKQWCVDKSVLSYFVNEIKGRKVSEASMQKIRDGYEKLPKIFEEI